MRFQNRCNKVAIELRVMQFWPEIILVISNQTAHSFDFQITRMIWEQMSLHSVQLQLLIFLKRIILHLIYVIKSKGHHAHLRENENLFRYQALLEWNLWCCVCAGAHVRTLMSWKSCTVGMRSAILSNHLNLFRTFIIKKREKV